MEKNFDNQPAQYIPANADYEKAEMDQLRNALRRSYTERFLIMTSLMKMNIMFKQVIIIRTPYTLPK
jgi:hypothetical protein